MAQILDDIMKKTKEDLEKSKIQSNQTALYFSHMKNGIKVDVADLGVEINFSKSRINSQIVEHIVKAI